MIDDGLRVSAFPYSGYWVDVGTLSSYWQSHMDLLSRPPSLHLNDRSWVIHTKSEERPPALLQSGALVRDSLICDGAMISEGAVVENSVLSPGVYIGPSAQISHSIILTDAHIASNASVNKAVVDKIVRVGEDCLIGKTDSENIATIGKASHIPPGTIIKPGQEIPTDSRPKDFT